VGPVGVAEVGRQQGQFRRDVVALSESAEQGVDREGVAQVVDARCRVEAGQACGSAHLVEGIPDCPVGQPATAWVGEQRAVGEVGSAWWREIAQDACRGRVERDEAGVRDLLSVTVSTPASKSMSPWQADGLADSHACDREQAEEHRVGVPAPETGEPGGGIHQVAYLLGSVDVRGAAAR